MKTFRAWPYLLVVVITFLAQARGTLCQELGAAIGNGSSSQRILAAPHRSVVFDGTPFSAGSVVPHWERGYLVSRNVEIGGPSDWAARLYDVSGGRVREIRFWVEGAARIFLNGASVTKQGYVVLAGVAEQTDGARAFFLAATDSTGQVTRIIRTNPYHVSRVCAAPDGTVWTFGIRSVEMGEKPVDAPTLRQYDLEKGELAALLPRSSFNTRFNPAASMGAGGSVGFACGADRIAIYSEVAAEFLEIDYATRAISRWRIEPRNDSLTLSGTAIAVTPSGEVYAILQRRDSQVSRSLYLLQRDPSKAAVGWLPVPDQDGNTQVSAKVSNLLGADGPSLVYLKRGADPAVQWARAEAR